MSFQCPFMDDGNCVNGKPCKVTAKLNITSQATLFFTVTPESDSFKSKMFDTLEQATNYILKIKCSEPGIEPTLTAKVILNYELNYDNEHR